VFFVKISACDTGISYLFFAKRNRHEKVSDDDGMNELCTTYSANVDNLISSLIKWTCTLVQYIGAIAHYSSRSALSDECMGL